MNYQLVVGFDIFIPKYLDYYSLCGYDYYSIKPNGLLCLRHVHRKPWALFANCFYEVRIQMCKLVCHTELTNEEGNIAHDSILENNVQLV